MTYKRPNSNNPDDYEVLIRRRSENDYASYCPQLNYMIKGKEHDEVYNNMKKYISDYIQSLQIEEEIHH